TGVLVSVLAGALHRARRKEGNPDVSAPLITGEARRAPLQIRLNQTERVLVALFMPLIAGVIQWIFWDQFKPFIWFLFYPATFLSAWIAGIRGSIPAAVLSIFLAVFLFVAPVLSFSKASHTFLPSAIIFLVMGALFGRLHDRLDRAKAETLALLEANRRRDQAALRSQEEMLTRMSRMAKVGGWGFDVATGAGEWTDEVARIHDLDPSVPVSAAMGLNYYAEGSRPAIEQAVREAIELARPYELELEILSAKGVAKWVRTQGQPVVEDGRVVRVQGSLQDITDRKQVEADLRESRATLQAALASMTDAVFISDSEGRFIDFNEAFATFHRFSSKEECARTFAEYPAFLEVYLPDGEVAPVEQWAVPRALRGETATNAEYTLRRKDTGETWVGSYSFAPIRDEDGAIVGSVVAGRDITEQKRIQEEILRLNSGLERRVEERTAELGAANHELEAFCYAVSHDLRAPLRAMSGFTQALVEDHGAIQPPEARTYLDQIVLGSRRMGELIDGLLTLSRSTLGDLRREPVNLSALARSVKAELQQIDPTRRVDWQIDLGLWVQGDPRMLLVALRNLLGNAWKYTAQQPAPRIAFDAIDQEGARIFRVSDNGAGFDMAYAAKLFHPFQRLHRQDEFPGLGIGLATVQRIIHRHGGRITAKSLPGQGATFQFTLPAVSEEFPS
ncbi:MAG TPA: ATP-binding protein, partial [Geothrix sp.]